MDPIDLALIYSTIDTQENAEKLCEQLLHEKLIACANIYPAGTSMYEWEGQLERNSEHVMILKTVSEKVEQLKHHILIHHPYECPCIVVLKSNNAHTEYAHWIKTQTTL